MHTQGVLFPTTLDLTLAEAVKERILATTHAANTLRAYRYSWRMFQRWCADAGKSALPATPQTCLDHAAWCIAQGYRLATVALRMKAANYAHRQSGCASPIDDSVWLFLRNARRALCERPKGKLALAPELLRRVSQWLLNRTTVSARRDRAIILLGFASGWRRSELVSLDLQDVRWTPQGIELWLAKSKTDQMACGRLVGISYGSIGLTCPIRALDQWLELRGRRAGPLFTTLTPGHRITSKRCDGDLVRHVVKRALRAIGEDPKVFGAHSLRAGMVTAAMEAGASETAVMMRTGHKTYSMIRHYSRPATVFRSDPLKGVL